MPKQVNKYQNETSPRKIAPEYTPKRNTKIPKKSTIVKQDVNKQKVKNKTKSKLKSQKLKKQQKAMIGYIIIGFAILFAISYRNSEIDENFKEMVGFRNELSELEKQNAQLKIFMEKGLNLNEVERQAKELLGMQKLNSRQTMYVSLPKTDYIEISPEAMRTEENLSIFQRIINFVPNIFK